MRIAIGRTKVVDLKIGAVVLLRAPFTNDILYNSGRLYFSSKAQYKLFKKKLAREDRRLQVVRVYIRRAKAPSHFKIEPDVLKRFLQEKPNNMYCPYCGSLEEWSHKHCPVCGISATDFWVKTYNGSWESGLANAKKD